MASFYEKSEHFVDKSIPYLIIILVGIVIIDIFYENISLKYQTTLLAMDGIVITFFVVDLVFKYNRVRDIPRFLKLYWLDILAVFPFFVLLRLFEEFLLISELSVTTLRNLFHAGLILEEEAVTARTTEIVVKESRLRLVLKWFKPLRRAPRFLKAISYFEHPKHRKTLYHT